MALIKCKECGHEISKKADKCPKCGHPSKKSNRVSWIAIPVILLVFYIYFDTKENNYPADKSLNKARSSVAKAKKKNEVQEIRVAPKDNINIRTGAGTNYPKDESGQLVEGEKLYVLEETNGWIRFRVTPEDVGWEGWVKKDLTRNWDKYQLDLLAEDVSYLEKKGVITQIDPYLNEVLVNPVKWNVLKYGTKEEIGRKLALYCGYTKGNKRFWVDIKDAYTGKKIAKYSRSYGFKVY